MRPTIAWVRQALARGGVLLAAAFGAGAAPVEIDYELIALATPGHYEYRYTVTNVSLAAPLSLISIAFDPLLYDESSLAVTSGAGTADWDQFLLGSVPLAGEPASFEAYNVAGTPLAVGDSLSGFSVRFSWLGTASGPGSQAFRVYDPGDLSNVLTTGTTTALAEPPPGTLPEPSSMALALLAAGGLAASRRRPVAA